MTEGTRVLVTGVAGFLGTNLLPRLLERGYVVVGLDNLTRGRRERIERHTGPRFQFVQADIRDAGAVQRAAEGVRHIIHLAEAKVPRQGSALEMLEANVRGTEQVLDAAVAAGARVVLGSTDAVYGKNPEAPLDEESALVVGQSEGHGWSLAVTKLMAEQLCFAYRDRHGLAMTILRYVGGYGPHQVNDRQGGPLPGLIGAAIQGQPMPIQGDGLHTRTVTHVADLVAGTILAMESPYAEGEILNLGSHDSVSILNLAYLVWRLAGNAEKPKLEFVVDDADDGDSAVRRRLVDSSKAHYLLGYEPRVALATGLKETLCWQAGELGIGAPAGVATT